MYEDNLFEELTKTVSLRLLNVTPVVGTQQMKSTKQQILGGQLPVGYNFGDVGTNTVEIPNDVDFGLIIFSDSNDYLLIGKLQHETKNVISFAKKESRFIIAQSDGVRSGAAGGVVFPDTNSKSLSKSTMNNRVVMQHRNGVGCSVSYTNAESKNKTFNGVYNQVKMMRMNKQTKRKIVLQSGIDRKILLEEMKSRFIAILLLLAVDGGQLVKQQNLIGTLIETFSGGNGDVVEFLSLGHSIFESFLLAWGVGSGVMHNHEAIAAHMDRNKNHPLETLTIYPCMPKDRTILTEGMGFLAFPLHGFNIKIKCVVDVVHCSLKNTVHIPDDSRSITNWSRVQGQ